MRPRGSVSPGLDRVAGANGQDWHGAARDVLYVAELPCRPRAELTWSRRRRVAGPSRHAIRVAIALAVTLLCFLAPIGCGRRGSGARSSDGSIPLVRLVEEPQRGRGPLKGYIEVSPARTKEHQEISIVFGLTNVSMDLVTVYSRIGRGELLSVEVEDAAGRHVDAGDAQMTIPFPKPGDFFSLGPGRLFGAVLSTTPARWSKHKPGRYRLRLVCYLGFPADTPEKFVPRNAWRGTVYSNWVTVDLE